MEVYPPELQEWPVPVVALVGLPHLHHSLSDAIVGDSMVNGSATMKVLSVEGVEHAIPRRKYKDRQRAELEAYDPAGLLKANWLEKHRMLLPAAIAVMFDFDDDPQWRDKETLVCSQLEVLRYNNRSRNLKILVVLVHSFHDRRASTMPEVTRDERLSSLKKRADLETKSVFLLSWADVRTSSKKLSKILQDLAVVWYKDEARRVKKYKERVSKSTQPRLFVRHHFKVAYYAEFRKEWKTAIKYYTSCYQLLRDLHRTDARVAEYKTVAEFITFRLSNVYQQTNQLAEAVDNFRNHVQSWKNSIGIREKEFEHWTWLSRQYLVFGDIVELFQGASASNDRRNHSGFYYQAAAACSMRRRSCAVRLLSGRTLSKQAQRLQDSLPSNHFISDLSSVTYVGQPIVPEGLDPVTIAMVAESGVKHSAHIIEMLTMAYEQCKQKKCTRMILNLASQMGEEYFQSADYVMAKRLFDRISKMYRREMWYAVLTRIIGRCLECASRLGQVRDCVEYSLELMTERMHISPQERLHVQASLQELVNQGQATIRPYEREGASDLPPSSPRTVTADPVQAIEPLELQLGMQPFDMDRDHAFASCKIRFVQPSVYLYQTVHFQLRLTLLTPQEFKFERLCVIFSEPTYNQTVFPAGSSHPPLEEEQPHAPTEGAVVEDAEQLVFQPGVERLFDFSFTAMESKTVECLHIQLHLGGPSPKPGVVLRWKGSDRAKKPSEPQHDRDRSISGDVAAHLDSDFPTEKAPLPREDPTKEVERSIVKILQPEPKLQVTLDHPSPALVCECYRITVKMNSGEDHLTSGVLNVAWAPNAVLENSAEEVVFYTDALATKPLQPSVGIPVPELAPNTEHCIDVFMVSPVAGDMRIMVKVMYDTKMNYKTAREELFHVHVQFPFKPVFEFVTNYMQESFSGMKADSFSRGRTTLHTGVPFTLRMDVHCSSPHRLRLLNTGFDPAVIADDNPKPLVGVEASSGEGCEPVSDIGTGERYTSCFQINPLQPTTIQSASIGDVVLYWIRPSSEDGASAPVDVFETFEDLRNELPPEGSLTSTIAAKGACISVMRISVPNINIEDSPFFVDIDLPQHGVVGSPFSLIVAVTNVTRSMQNITLTVGDSESFCIDAPAKVEHRIIPGRCERMVITLVPVQTGHVPIPPLLLTSLKYKKDLIDTQAGNLRYVFVEPTSSN